MMTFRAWAGRAPDGTARPSEVERRLVLACERGEPARCVDVAGPERVVSAALVEALARGRLRCDGGVIDGRRDEIAPGEIDGGVRLDASPRPIGGTEGKGGDGPAPDQTSGQDAVDAAMTTATGIMQMRAEGESAAASLDALHPAPGEGGRVRVIGPLNLERLDLRGSLWLRGCRFDDVVRLSDGQIGGSAFFDDGAFLEGILLDDAEITGQLSLNRCLMAGGVRAQGLRAGSVFMNGRETLSIGPLVLTAAQINGQVSMNGARFIFPQEIAIHAQSCRATAWFMQNAIVVGQLNVNAARLSGQFVAEGSVMLSGDPENKRRCLHAQNLHASALFLDRCVGRGMIDVNAAEINGQVSFNDVDLLGEDPENGRAVNAQTLSARGLFMVGAKTDIHGGVDLTSATIRGPVVIMGAAILASGSTALRADYALIEGQFSIVPLGGQQPRCVGRVSMIQCRLQQGLDARAAFLVAKAGMALDLRGARSDGEVLLDLADIYGTVDLSRAKIDSRLSFKGTKLVAPAVEPTRAARFIVPPTAAVDALVAQLAQARAAGGEDALASVAALVMEEAEVKGRLVMPKDAPIGVVDLTRASCDTLDDLDDGWPTPLPRVRRRLKVPDDRRIEGAEGDCVHLVLDGFRFQNFEHPDGTAKPVARDVGRARIGWLTAQGEGDLKRHFNPQPWRMTARVLREMGYDEAANRVSIERRVRQRFSDNTRFGERLVNALLHWVAAYGYNPWRALFVALAAVLFFAGAFWVGHQACRPEGACGVRDGAIRAALDEPLAAAEAMALEPAAFMPVRVGDAPTAYPRFNPLLYSLDTFVPVLDLNTESFWRADRDVRMRAGAVIAMPFERTLTVPWEIPIGWALYALAILERIVGALITAIAIVGFTGLVRREESIGA